VLKKGYYESKGYEIFKQYENYRKQYRSLASDFQISFLLGLIKYFKFFMEKGKGKDFYDSSFSNEFNNILLKQVEIYEKDYILLQHETNFFNYLFNNVVYLLNENKQMKKNINDYYKQNSKLKHELIKNKKELDVIKDSKSWKLTKPFRKLRNLFK
jgi:hypothetical protein